MKGEKDDPSESEIAENIRQVLASSRHGNEKLPPDEKEFLWRRLNESLFRKTGVIRRLNRLKTVAAAVFLLAAAVWLMLPEKVNDTVREMKEIALLADTLDDSPEIQLLTTENETALEVRVKPVYNTLIVPYGKRKMLTLQDSTSVWLNSGSKLVYPEVFSGNERQVYLEGEAYFIVRHDENRPFYVQTYNMEVKVLGTEFNVSAYDDDEKSHVMLVKGSVELTTGRNALHGKIKTRLVPHEVAVYDAAEEGLEISNMEVEEYVSWRNGYMAFRNTPLEIILKKLERYYRVDIELREPGLEEETFTGPLDLKKNIQEVMNIICMTTSLVYEEKEGKILLKGNK